MKKILPLSALLLSFLLLAFTARVGAYNPGDTLVSFNAGILTPTPDRALYGIVFAEEHYWISGADPGAGWQHKLYKISADGQNLVDYWTYNNSLQNFWKGLAYDGEYLYGTGIDTIYQINMQSGQRTGIKIKAPMYYTAGIAYDPQTDQFWVSGDGNIIYRINREGAVTSSMAFIQDFPTAGLAWDTWTPGGPYLWVWSRKYTSTDVRPKAFQMNPATGQLTGVDFEGVNMFPSGVDGPLGFSLSDEVIPGKVVFTALQSSNYQQFNDQLDWVVLYDLDVENSGIPGPQISVNLTSIQNDLMPGDSLDILMTISNFSENWGLNWTASLEYPDQSTGDPGSLLNQIDFTTILPDSISSNISSAVFLKDHFYIATKQGFNQPASLVKISRDGTTIVSVSQLFQSSPGGSAMATDGNKIFISSTYVIFEFDPDSGMVTDFVPKPNFFARSMAYDSQNERFFLAGGSSIMTINKSGDELNFYTSSYEINGLAWDRWSSGGPYLWVHTSDEEGLQLIRINPSTGGATEISFQGTNLGAYSNFPDQPGDVFVAADYQQNKLVLMAVNEVYDSISAYHDHLLVYDLEVIPPPRWITFQSLTTGSALPLESSELLVRLHAIMEDTLMTAQIVIHSNDVLNPSFIVPVNFRMLPNSITGISTENESTAALQIDRIFPNPAIEQSTIQLNMIKEGSLRIDLVNIYGSTVYQSEKGYVMPGLHQYRIPLHDLPAGIYFVRTALNGEILIDKKTILIKSR